VPALPWGDRWRPRVHGPLLQRLAGPDATVILTRPDQAPLLPCLQQHRRVYYVVDDYLRYRATWIEWERALVASADHVVAISSALGQALMERFGIRSDRLTISPNAVSAADIPACCPTKPAALPEGLDLPRPLAGVIGRISSRIRLDWLIDLVEQLPWLHWLFVGDVETEELVPSDVPVLRRLRHHRRCTFVGRRSYEQLAGFAAALDVAVLPYSALSVNPLGSSMRFFLQLPYGTPILATPGCPQLEEFVPLVQLCPTCDSLAAALGALRERNLDDGLRKARWSAAHSHTWENRAEALIGLMDHPPKS